MPFRAEAARCAVSWRALSSGMADRTVQATEWLGGERGGRSLPARIKAALLAGFAADVWDEDSITSIDETNPSKASLELWQAACEDSFDDGPAGRQQERQRQRHVRCAERIIPASAPEQRDKHFDAACAGDGSRVSRRKHVHDRRGR